MLRTVGIQRLWRMDGSDQYVARPELSDLDIWGWRRNKLSCVNISIFKTLHCDYNIITKFMLLIGIVPQKNDVKNVDLPEIISCYQRAVFVVQFWTWWGEGGSLAQKSLIFLRKICSKLPYLVRRDPTDYHVSIICLMAVGELGGGGGEFIAISR